MRHFATRSALTDDVSDMEKLTMQSQTLTGAAVLMGMFLTGCGPEPGPTSETAVGPTTATADFSAGSHTRFVEQFTEPLVNPCNGEVIVFAGVATSQINRTGDFHLEFVTRASGTGTGPESGATYQYSLTAYETTNWGNGNDLQGTGGAGANARMISSLPELTFTAHFQFHGVALPSGEIAVTRDVDRVECKA